jgi:uncharacterized membrane protein YoaK (UPF0700 family)
MTEMTPAPRRLEFILCCTTFAVGAVDIISFARLGGVFASAMTGNLALLGLYTARGQLAGMAGTLTALSSFIGGAALGNLLVRRRPQDTALALLLGLECLLMLGAVALWFTTPHAGRGVSADRLVCVLALAMGLQSITGKRLNLSSIPTVVFTSTLTNIVITLTEMLATRSFRLPGDTRRQIATFFIYFLGALSAGLAVVLHSDAVVALPAVAMLAAFAAAWLPPKLSRPGLRPDAG